MKRSDYIEEEAEPIVRPTEEKTAGKKSDYVIHVDPAFAALTESEMARLVDARMAQSRSPRSDVDYARASVGGTYSVGFGLYEGTTVSGDIGAGGSGGVTVPLSGRPASETNRGRALGNIPTVGTRIRDVGVVRNVTRAGEIVRIELTNIRDNSIWSFNYNVDDFIDNTFENLIIRSHEEIRNPNRYTGSRTPDIGASITQSINYSDNALARSVQNMGDAMREASTSMAESNQAARRMMSEYYASTQPRFDNRPRTEHRADEPVTPRPTNVFKAYLSTMKKKGSETKNKIMEWLKK